MLTNTPLDLTPFGSILQGIGLLYWLFVIVVLALVLVKVKGRIAKTFSAIAILAILVGPMIWRVATMQKMANEHKAKMDVATKLFDEYCKTSGEKISKTVENVDGVFWMKWRGSDYYPSNQFTIDPYGHDCSNEECIGKLLRATDFSTAYPEDVPRYSKGFWYVDSIDPRDGQLYRYTGHLKARNEFKVERKAIDRSDVKYGITWDDISSYDDREKWIAGGSLTVIDLETKEVIAERRGFMMDKMQGDKGHARSPWPYAEKNACPAIKGERRSYRENDNFIFKTLTPTEGK